MNQLEALVSPVKKSVPYETEAMLSNPACITVRRALPQLSSGAG